jgi:hypothetical protein
MTRQQTDLHRSKKTVQSKIRQFRREYEEKNRLNPYNLQNTAISSLKSLIRIGLQF